MENRVLIQITNDSEHTFAFDGDFMRNGAWKMGRDNPITPKTVSVIEFHSTELKGVACVAWWVDNKDHNKYISLAVTNPRLQVPTFVCYAGLPPPNIKAEMETAPKLLKDEQVTVDNAGCAWVAASVGDLTVIKLTIFPEPAAYIPPTFASVQAAAPSAEAVGAAVAFAAAAFNPPARNGGNTAASSGAAEPCTTLVATGAATDEEPVDDEAERDAVNKFFAQTRPKDAMDGLSQGLKTAGIGVVAGVGNIVASTVSGVTAHDESANGWQRAWGGLKGFGVGVLGGAAIAVGGTACGVAQIGRGIANTPEALRSRKEQRVWDPELGQWVDIDLCAMEGQVAEEGSDDEGPTDGSAGGYKGATEVLDTEFYDVLRVPVAASQSDIKKAYYKEARQCHPDKNPGDEKAKAKFQKLADAYQVLSDPQSRKKYDREGKKGLQEGEVKMDPSMFFSLLFGSERFDPWIGELHLAMQTDQFVKTMEKSDLVSENASELDALGDSASKSMKRRQNHREVHCACHLRDKLDRWVYERNYEGFEEQMRLEASTLASGQFGPELLTTLGEIYQLRSELYLADELIGRFSLTKRVASFKHSTATMGHRMQFYQQAAGSLWQVKKMHDAATSSQTPQTVEGENQEVAAGEVTETATAEAAEEKERQEVAKEEKQREAIETALEEALPMFLQTAWSCVITDIDGTITEVTRKLLKDKSAGWQIRLRRAQALQRLGDIFVEEGSKAEAAQGSSTAKLMSSDAAKASLQEALMGSVREKKSKEQD